MKVGKILKTNYTMLMTLVFFASFFYMLILLSNADGDLITTKNKGNASILANSNISASTQIFSNGNPDNNIDFPNPIFRYIENEKDNTNRINYKKMVSDTNSEKNNKYISNEKNKKPFKEIKIIECKNRNFNAYEIKDIGILNKFLKKDTTSYLKHLPMESGRGFVQQYDPKSDTKIIFICINENYNFIPEKKYQEPKSTNKYFNEEISDHVGKVANTTPNKESMNKKIIEDLIDNENKKLYDQIPEYKSSIFANMQHPPSETNILLQDRKPIANAGLDQLIQGGQNILLDASASIDPEGKISNYLWKQIGSSEEQIEPSNSKIYSFPIPDNLDENELEFGLTITDKDGMKDTDTVKIIIKDDNSEENRNT